MPHSNFSSDEIVERGQKLYDRQIRHNVESQNRGKFLVLNIETGEYEIDADKMEAFSRAAAKHPGSALYILRVGFPAAVKIGGNFKVERV